MVQRAKSQDEQTVEAQTLGFIPAKCVVLQVNHQKRTIDYSLWRHDNNSDVAWEKIIRKRIKTNNKDSEKPA